ncbi:MAG: hypothetical protein KDK78_08020 [Chlamydiia bacterium]|nr:hypothetical protein [Chlamydiia bacterium]
MQKRSLSDLELPPMRDKTLVVTCFLLAVFFVLPIPNPFTPGSAAINAALRQALPLQVAVLALGIPFAIHYALYMFHISERNVIVREAERRERIRLTGRILFRSYFRPHLDGSTWELVNFNKFPWTDTRVLIERERNGELVCEKHQLGSVEPGHRLKVESELQDGDFVIWRVMVLTREGSQTDFPERGFRKTDVMVSAETLKDHKEKKKETKREEALV